MEERLTFLLSSELKQKIELAAKKNEMNISTYIRLLVIQQLKKEGDKFE